MSPVSGSAIEPSGNFLYRLKIFRNKVLITSEVIPVNFVIYCIMFLRSKQQ